MYSISKVIYISFSFCISILLVSTGTVTACKDIIATGDATAGDYNLLLKVRDPSRPDYQVLTIVPKGYQYQYHHPWTGKPMDFEVEQSLIGVASLGDTIPDIVKPGMCFTKAGLAFGDADTISNWKNPTTHGWDDFDWIRYAAQTANTEEEAIRLLTKDAVDTLHAPAVPENLFVVGPEDGYVIEADVIHHSTNKVDDYVAMSNYAKELWKKSLIYRAIAPSFDATFEGTVRRGRTIRLGLGSIFGIRILDIGDDYIVVKQIPIQFSKGNIRGRSFDLFDTTTIELHNTEKVGFYRVNLIDIEGRKATISMCYEYKEWEETMHDIIQAEYGSIDVSDMMNWSRLHSHELNGLRSMCGEHEAFRYEGDMIFKIPKNNYEVLSEGWFSPNHACSSLYVPVHICDTDIYTPYMTGRAAEVCLQLLDSYGHGYLSKSFHETEQVFINEIRFLQPIIHEILDTDTDIADFYTISDKGMQKQAYLTQVTWLDANTEPDKEHVINILNGIWEHNYSTSLQNMKDVVTNQNETYDLIDNMIINVATSIVETRIDMCKSIDLPYEYALNLYEESVTLINENSYEAGFSKLIESYQISNTYLTEGYNTKILQEKQKLTEEDNFTSPFFILLFCAIFLFVIVGVKQALEKRQ